jgi:hypothetical protein
MMTIAFPSSTLVTTKVSDLSLIREPYVNLVVLQRQTSPELLGDIEEFLSTRDGKREATLNPGQRDLAAFFEGLPNHGGAAALRDDIGFQVGLLDGVIPGVALQFRLQSVADNLCERFHVDQVQLRLICTYVGPGTEWLENGDVRREKLGPGSGGLPDERSGLIRDGAAVRQMGCFAIGLMKGERWPGNRGQGLVHRSPRLRDAAQRRVLFKIDVL